MTLNPDNPTGQRKEAILDQCPLTRSFIDKRTFRVDTSAWSRQFNEEGSKLQEEVGAKLGDENQTKILGLMLVFLNARKILNPNMEDDVKTEAVKSLFVMGYEIGEADKSNLLLPDIVDQFKETKLINPELMDTPENISKISDSLAGVLRAGKYYRSLNSVESHLEQDEVMMPEVFRKFINGLDF